MWKISLSVAHLSAIGICLGLAAACGESSTGSVSDLESGFAVVTTGDLEQRVTVTPAVLALGEQLVVASEVLNRGSISRTLTSRICGLDLETTVELTGSLLMCAGYSMRGDLEPGHTTRSFDAVVVTSGHGKHTLRIRHLIEPEVWVSVPIVVR